MNTNIRGYTYFVWLHPSKAAYTFTGYTDRDGEHRYIGKGTDERGNQLERRFKFTPSRRIISIPNTQQDVIMFLKDHPNCGRSRNGYFYENEKGEMEQRSVVFKEMNDGADAEIAIEAIADKAEATSVALTYRQAVKDKDVSGLQELEELALLTGYRGSDDRLRLHHVLQFAENSPAPFMDIYKDPTRRVRFLVRKGLSEEKNVLKKKGFMIYWGDIHLGNDEDQAIQLILKDKELLEAIEEQIKKE